MRLKLLIVGGVAAVVLASYAVWWATGQSQVTKASPEIAKPKSSEATARPRQAPTPSKVRPRPELSPSTAPPPTPAPLTEAPAEPAKGEGKVTREDLGKAETLEEVAELLERAGKSQE